MSITTDDLRARLSLGAVAVVGAGLSLSARYPNTKNLAALVWDAVDRDLSARAGLAERLGVPDAPTKILAGDDWGRLEEAWATITSSPTARERFQTAFVALDAQRASQHSIAHEALARLIHEGSVELVVSFNWDSALERAYERLYGTSLPAGVLHKPHGDVARPGQPWVLPHADGSVSEAVLARVSELLDEHPRTLLVVGYSGSDQAVVDQLIAPLDARWRVTRVSPHATGADDAIGTAADVLGIVAQPVLDREASSPWSTVTFTNQRGIESALAGHRLGPRDVAACPRLPVFDAVFDSLLQTHAVVLNGESGSGKSISAYQVASELARQGYEVLRLRDSQRLAGMGVWLSALNAFPHRKLLLIDDAQDLSADTVREMAESATGDQLILIVGVDHVAGGVVTHTAVSAAAVGVLERFMLDNRTEMLPKVRKLDNRIGTTFGERLDLRIRRAAKERNAWLFFYSLTGGWGRTARIMQETRECDRADILACALAVAQIAGVDNGISAEALTQSVKAFGRDQRWVEEGLTVLRAKQLAFEQDGLWRCPHLRTAYAILDWMLHPPVWPSPPLTPPVKVTAIASADVASVSENQPPAPRAKLRPRPALPETVIEEDRQTAVALIEDAVNRPSASMRGIAWLLGRDFSSEVRWVLAKHGVRTPDRNRVLATRALATPPGPDVAMAAQLLEQLSGPDAPEVVVAIWEGIASVLEWIRAVTPQDGWAIGSLVNVLMNDDRERLAAAISTIDPTRLTHLYEEGGWPHIYSSHRAVDRISQGGGLDLLVAVGKAFDEPALQRMLDTAPRLASANELLATFPYTNPEMGIRLFESHAEQFAKAFSRDPLGEYADMFHTFAFLLGYAPEFLRHRKPSTAQRRAVRTFLRALDTRRLEYELARPEDDARWQNFWEFIAMFSDADPSGLARVADTIDLDQLEKTLVEQLPTPGGNLLLVLHLLVETRPDEVKALLDLHEHELARLDSYLAFVHPELVVRLLKRGLPLDLHLEHQNYRHAAAALASVGSQQPKVAAEVAEANGAAFAAGLAKNHSQPFEGLQKWVVVCDHYAPGFVDNTLEALEAGVVAEWARALRVAKSKREIGPLVVRAAQLEDCPAAHEATALMKQFPSVQDL